MFGLKQIKATSRKRACNLHQDDRTDSKRQRFLANGHTIEEPPEYSNNQVAAISADFSQMSAVQNQPYEELPMTSAQALQNMSNYSELPSGPTASMLVNGGSFGGVVSTEHWQLGSPPALQNNCEMSLMAGSSTGRLFTHDEVRSICQSELQAQEEQLRTEYEKCLSNELARQFDFFQKYIDEEIKKKHAGYLDNYVS